MNKIKGSLAILGTAMIYGSFGIWAKLIGSDFQIFFQTYSRGLIAWMIVLGIVWYLKDWKKIKNAYDYKILFLIAFLGIFTQAIYYAFITLGIGLTSLLLFSSMLVTQFFMGYFVYGEKIGMLKVLSLALAFLGITLVFKNQIFNLEISAVASAIIAGVCTAAQASVTKLVSKTYSSWQISIFSWAGIVAVCLPLSLYFGEVQKIPEMNLTWVYLLCFALAGLLTYPLLIYGFKRIDVSLAGLIGLVEIPVAILFGYFVFNEVVTGAMVLGSLLIICAAALPDIVGLIKKRKLVN